MIEQNPYDRLGVSEDSSFDEIQDARNRLMQQYNGDRKQQELIEIAYDSILMDRLRLRREGRIKVPDLIRFPEKAVSPPPSSPAPSATSPAWLQQFLDTPGRSELLWSGGIFGGLAALSFLVSSPDGTLLQVTLALGIGATLYFLNRKERKFGRSLLLTLGGLVVGLVLGGVLASFVPAYVIPDETFATLVTLLILWIISGFLR
ncbi:MAG: CPP1-like family protein [Leptolyngbyaceae cyanobacterium bins.59]|nr:CPP1-like family protein [Leptolyngbyaceae cyanobacterium bins.59]